MHECYALSLSLTSAEEDTDWVGVDGFDGVDEPAAYNK